MTKTDTSRGPARRDLFSLAAAATVTGLAAASGAKAQARAAPAVPGEAAKGPGVPTPTAVVQTRSGPVQGLVVDGVHSFKGLPYGAAPIGALRWAPPQPPKPWKGIYDASDFGAPAMQMAGG